MHAAKLKFMRLAGRAASFVATATAGAQDSGAESKAHVGLTLNAEAASEGEPPARAVADAVASRRPRRSLGRAAFYGHLWLGVISTVALIAISITGILLNHKRGLGLMPDVAHEASGAFASSLALERLAAVALAAAPAAARPGWSAGDPVDLALIDRMDVRPRNGLVKVRLRDKASTEVTVDLASGAVVHVGRRGDVFVEKLHSGEIFGGTGFVVLSDIAAVALVLTLITGYWLWLVPKWSRGARTAEGEAQ